MKNVWMRCLTVLLLVSMIAVFAACTGDNETTTPNANETTTPNPGTQPNVPDDPNYNGATGGGDNVQLDPLPAGPTDGSDPGEADIFD